MKHFQIGQFFIFIRQFGWSRCELPFWRRPLKTHRMKSKFLISFDHFCEDLFCKEIKKSKNPKRKKKVLCENKNQKTIFGHQKEQTEINVKLSVFFFFFFGCVIGKVPKSVLWNIED